MKRKIIAVGNQKGGVGKTTTALNLGAALSKQGYNVLLIDFDQQGNLSNYLGYHPKNDKDITIYDLLKEMVSNSEVQSLKQAIHNNSDENIDYIPADISLSNAEMLLFTAMSREQVLKGILENKLLDKYDYVIIDCLPGIGILFINAIASADGLIIPVQSHKFGLDGLIEIFNVFNKVKKFLNSKLEMYGILATMTDNTVISREIVATLKNNFNNKVFNTSISRRVEAPESTYSEKSLINTKNSVIGAEYIEVTNELLQRIKGLEVNHNE